MNGKSVLHGVVSWGVACDVTDNFGAVFANVFNMIGFIRDVLVRICASCKVIYTKYSNIDLILWQTQ